MPSGPRSSRFQKALWIDKWLGPVLCATLLAAKQLRRRERPIPPAETVRRVLVLKLWGMGSIVLASPLLQELRARYPEARIVFVTLEENAAILSCVPAIDGSITIDLSRGIPRFFLQTLAVIWRVRRERYDLLMDLEFFTRFSAIFSFLARPRCSYGFSSKGSMRGQLHDAEVPFNTYNHVVLNFLSLLRGKPVEPLPEFEIAGPRVLPAIAASDATAAALARRLAAKPGFREGRSLVAVNPNAGDMALERRWPEKRMLDFLKGLCTAEDVNVVLTGGPSEREFVASLVDASGLGERVVNLAGEIGIDELVALFNRSDVVVTNDSGPLHIAAAAGASVVALFGPETPTLYGPLRSRPEQHHTVHYRRMACSPCMFVHDNKVLDCWFAQALCMRGIAAEDVLASVRERLAEKETT
jgi:lipopolysaccharide heptosyltransferase II